MWCQFILNSKKSNNLLCRNFSMFINDYYFINLLLFSFFFFSKCLSSFFLGKPLSDCFSWYMSERRTLKKLLKKFLKLFTSVEKPTSTRYKLSFSLVSSSNKPFLFEKHSALLSALFFQVPFWPRKYKK